MVYFLFLLVVAAVCLCLGARFHSQINARVARIFGKGDDLPADFQLWLNRHKGEYETLGQAMSAWADARFGDKHNNILK